MNKDIKNRFKIGNSKNSSAWGLAVAIVSLFLFISINRVRSEVDLLIYRVGDLASRHNDLESIVTEKAIVTEKVHIVQYGDTFGGIAEKYNTTPSEIRKWNNIKESKVATLYIGQKLQVSDSGINEDKHMIEEINNKLSVLEKKVFIKDERIITDRINKLEENSRRLDQVTVRELNSKISELERKLNKLEKSTTTTNSKKTYNNISSSEKYKYKSNWNFMGM